MITAADEKLKGSYVSFLVKDIHHPEPTHVLHELHDNDELKGLVLDLSDSAHAKGAPFVIVKVRRLRKWCIVPVDRLLPKKKAPVPR
jgi:hypothetical protein